MDAKCFPFCSPACQTKEISPTAIARISNQIREHKNAISGNNLPFFEKFVKKDFPFNGIANAVDDLCHSVGKIDLNKKHRVTFKFQCLNSSGTKQKSKMRNAESLKNFRQMVRNAIRQTKRKPNDTENDVEMKC